MGLPGLADAPQTLIDFEKEKEGRISKRLVMHYSNTKRTINVLVDYREEVPGCRIFALYVPYWLINRSQKPLHYRNPNEKAEEFVAVAECTFILYLLLFLLCFYCYVHILFIVAVVVVFKFCILDTTSDEAPFLYSENKINVRTPDSQWSKVFTLLL
jgi:hypothetical protein